ncbi:T9SS type A sorting domain-containing protein [Constantimarinum furrinae]|uniref:Secretion system C-terminal sorting domain-containing protein n=1 Tax=Constantimarinum furrinae TaxID=2562285 RepID=A0A7G8PXZ0_9FLAO|nr:T9SS type A sorting domain-containing protein [Constantimarinum furrinae]QNJ99206.1 hypothetical protein ALE3EI_2679 [Constantimarinum furrinae]
MKLNYSLKDKFLQHSLVLGLSLLLSGMAYSQGCTDPVITATSGPGTICEGETASLTATHNGQSVNWYDAASGGNLLGSGSPFVSAPLSATTSFWAEAVNGGTGTPVTGAARVAPTNTTNSAVVAVTSPWGLSFDANVDFTINTVDVFLASNSPGTVVMQLKDSGLNIIEQVSIAVPAGNSTTPVQHTLNLDFFVPAGLDYDLVAESSPNMVREFSSGHPGFPYPIGTIGTVVGGTINDNNTNSTVYYFFYNWTVTPGENCTSARMEEVVNVTVTPAPTGDSNQTFVAGETLADLDVTGTNLTWYSDAAGTNVIPDTTPLQDGTTYYVSSTDNSCESQLLAITVTETLGVPNESLRELRYYPSPVSTVLEISNAEPILKVEVYNILGQQVLYVNNDTSEVSLDMASLNAGAYFIKVATETGATSFKVLKE